MAIRRTLATLALVLLILVAGIALLYAMRALLPPTAVSSSAPTATATAAPTATAASSATPVASASVPGAWASTCGTLSGVVSFTANESFVLNSPGRPPLKVAIPTSSPGAMSGYICASIYGTGAPSATFLGLWPPNTAGFIPEGTLPASKASQMPDGFVLPQACIYIAPPIVGTDQRDWSVDCGATANREARGALAPALTQQGWSLCASVTATASWAKGTTRLSVVETSGSPGDYPRMVQPVRPAASNACP